MSDENEGGDVIHLPPRSDTDDLLSLPERTYTGTSTPASPIETTLELPVVLPERTAADDLAEVRPAERIPAPPGLPATFRSDGVDEPRETAAPVPQGGPALAAAAVMAAALAALRGMAGWLSDRRARRQSDAEQAAPLREARQKALLAQEEAAADHALAMRKMRDKSAQQRERSRVPSGQEWGQKTSGRGSGGGKNSSGGTGPKSPGKGSSGAHNGSGKNGGIGNGQKGNGPKSGTGGNGQKGGTGSKGAVGKDPGSKGAGADSGQKGGRKPRKSDKDGTKSPNGRREKPKSPLKDQPRKSSGGSAGGSGGSGRNGGAKKPGTGSGKDAARDKPLKKPSGAGPWLDKVKADRKRHKNSPTAPTDLNGKQDKGKTSGKKGHREKPKAPKQGAAGYSSPWRDAFRKATTAGTCGSRATGSHRSRARTDQEQPRRPWEDPDRRQRSKARSDRSDRQRRQWRTNGAGRSRRQHRDEKRAWQDGARPYGTGACGDRSAWDDVRGATGPIPAADAGITVERVRPRKQREKRSGPAAIGRAPRSLPRAPENGTQRPGTQKPGPQKPGPKSTSQNGARMTGTSRLSAEHATEMNLDEYLVSMTKIAHAAATDREGARTIAETMLRIAKALEIISEDIAGAHNLGREVVDQIDSLTQDSEVMKSKALEMTKRFSSAADLAFTVAVEVGKDYRQDKDAKDDVGLAHASAAAHHSEG